MTEIYISTDVESDGPIPGPNSMLSFGSAAYTADKQLLSTFSANLETLPGAEADPKTAAWWKTQPEAWAACRTDLQDPARAMKNYVAWLKGLPARPVFVAYPAGFDFLFVYWYLMRFAGESPFSHSALDVKSFAMAMLKLDYRDSTKRAMPKRWFDKLPHTHIALDDAIEQGALFCNMLAENRRAAKHAMTTARSAAGGSSRCAPCRCSWAVACSRCSITPTACATRRPMRSACATRACSSRAPTARA
jgi:hypothetical protein